MKKFIIMLMAALWGCGLAWAGVTVTGKVTVTGQAEDFANGAKVILSNDDMQLVSIVEYPNSYSFSNVPAGTYTMSCKHQGWGSTTLYAVEEIITVGEEKLTKNLELSQMEGTYYTLTVKAGVYAGTNSMGNPKYDQVVGAQISLGEKGSDKKDKGTLATKYDDVVFYCKENTEYELVARASGYKTVKETVSLSESTNKQVVMEEGEDETEEGNAQLSGMAVMEGGGVWPAGLSIALGDASNNLLAVVSDLSGGSYSFPNIELKSAVKFYLTTDMQNPTYNLVDDYVFVEGDDEFNPLEYTMPAQAGEDAVVYKNLTVRYKGSAKATLVGAVLDGTTGRCIDGVEVTIRKGEAAPQTTTTRQNSTLSGTPGIDCSNGYVYNFTNMEAGTYTLTYSKYGYEPATQNYTLIITGSDQKFVVPAITLENKPMKTCTFSGDLTYTDEATSKTVAVSKATVTAYSDAAGTQILGSTATDTNGHWSMKLTREEGDVVYFDATHDDIEVANKTSQIVNDEAYTITIVFTHKGSAPPEVEKVTLTLGVNNADWGTVTTGATVGTTEFAKGTALRLTATPNTGYAFKAWVSGTDTLAKTAVYTFTIDRDTTLTAVFEERQTPPETEKVTLTLSINHPNWGTVTGATVGTNEFEKGSEVTLTATPNEGFAFKAWNENGATVSTQATYTFTLNADRTLMVEFAEIKTPTPDDPEKVTLTLTANEAAWGTVTGAGQYDKGAQATATATAHEGYAFKAWVSGTDTLAKTAGYTFTIDRDTTLMAVFEQMQTPPVPPVPVDSFDVTLRVNDAAMGTVTGEGRYEEGTRVSVKATPNEGYAFKAWVSGADTLIKTAEFRFIINRDTTLTAVFEVMQTPPTPPVPVDSFDVTLRVNDAAMGTVTGEGRYEEGSEVTVTATANEGYVFVAWMSGTDTLAKTAEYTFTVVGDTTLTAVFKSDGTPEPPVANEAREQDAWNVYTEGRTLVLRGDAACRYDIYNVSGVLVKCVPAAANECRIAVDNSGLYIIRRMSSTGTSVKKVMVR